MNERPSRIRIVDDHELLAETVALALEGRGHDAAVVAMGSPDEIVARVAESGADIVLLDLDLGRAGSSIPLIPRLRQTGARVLVVTGVTDRMKLARAVAAGAEGTVPKEQRFDELVEAIERVVAGEPAMAPGEREAVLRQLADHEARETARLAPFYLLTDREAAVLGGLMAGQTAEQVAAASYVSVATVRTQIRGILRKLGVKSQLHAVVMAREAGWVPPSRD